MSGSGQGELQQQHETNQPQGTIWTMPEWYGSQEALTSMGTIAAPLLAGFSLAAVVQTLTLTSSETRWSNASVLLFLLAAVLLIAAVQAAFWARQYQTSPSEIKDWWPDADRTDRLAQLRHGQKLHAAGFRVWTNRARVVYDAGLLCLIAALTILAVPAASDNRGSALRWVAVAVGALAFVCEVIWIAGSFAPNKWKWSARLLMPPDIGSHDLQRCDE